MKNKILVLFISLLTAMTVTATPVHGKKHHHKAKKHKAATVKEKEKEKKEEEKLVVVDKIDTTKIKLKEETLTQTDSLDLTNAKLKFLKKNAHASYYANKFDGHRTASGSRFSNSGLTAAHKKLPFGTKVKVTNEANGKSVIVEVTDRGPFSKVREIDLSKKAFMEIASTKNSGVLIVTLEVIEPK